MDKNQAIQSPKDIGTAVRHARKRQGLKQAEAAGLLGVGVRFLSELERGKDTLALGKVLQVMRGLGLQIDVYDKSMPEKGGV